MSAGACGYNSSLRCVVLSPLSSSSLYVVQPRVAGRPQALVKAGASVDRVDKDGRTALIAAITDCYNGVRRHPFPRLGSTFRQASVIHTRLVSTSPALIVSTKAFQSL